MESQSVGSYSPSRAPRVELEALLRSDPKRAWLGKFLTAALSPSRRTGGGIFEAHKQVPLAWPCPPLSAPNAGAGHALPAFSCIREPPGLVWPY